MSFAPAERTNWSFSLRLALGVGAVFALAGATLYFGVGALLERALAREEVALVLDRREDFRLAWQDGGADGLKDLMKNLESTTGEQLAVRVLDARQGLVFSTATGNAPDVPWAALPASTAEGSSGVTVNSGWTASAMGLPEGGVLQLARHSGVPAEVRETYTGLFATIFVPLLLLGIAGGALMVYLSLRPLRHTVELMREIVQTGDWAKRVAPPRSAGEMRDLALAFNALLDRQQRLVDSLRQSLDYVAHDLRTPLTRLRVAVESAMQDDGEGNQGREHLSDCLEEVQRVQATLDTLMDVAEAEAGGMKLKLETIDPTQLLAEVAELYEFVAEEKGARLEIKLDAGWSFAGDRVRLRRALANLVDNALKYLGHGRLVILSAQATGAEVVLMVKDDGMGISPQDLPRIWERLFRADRSRSAPGMGLGLSLVRAIVEAHGGRAEAESVLGGGTTFRLRLPSGQDPGSVRA